MSRPIPVSYYNASGEDIPPYAVIQVLGDSEQTLAGVISVMAVKPSGNGVFAVDSGKGSTATGNGAYGQCYFPTNHNVWAKFSGSPPAAWTDVGPTAGSWELSSGVSGFLYSGICNGVSGLMLVKSSAAGSVVIDSSGNGGSCGCCDCFECDEFPDVTTCSSCPSNAPTHYFVAVGSWPDFPDLGGSHDLTYDSGCTWKGPTIWISTSSGSASYHWELFQDDLSSTLKLINDSGTDPFDLAGHPMTWIPDETTWSCLCAMKMKADAASFPRQGRILNCNICVVPRDSNTCGCYKLTVSGVSGTTPPQPTLFQWNYNECWADWNGDYLFSKTSDSEWPVCKYVNSSVGLLTYVGGVFGWYPSPYATGVPTYQAAPGEEPLDSPITLTKVSGGTVVGTWPETVTISRATCLGNCCYGCFTSNGVEGATIEYSPKSGGVCGSAASSANQIISSTADVKTFNFSDPAGPIQFSYYLSFGSIIRLTPRYALLHVYSSFAGTSTQATYYCCDWDCGGDFDIITTESPLSLDFQDGVHSYGWDWPSTITVSLGSCDTTTTTSTTTSTTTPGPTSTTTSDTTSTTTSGPTTTTSTTSTTTGSTTTGHSCIGTCHYSAVLDGDVWIWQYQSSDCSLDCGCPATDAQFYIDHGVATEGATLEVSCQPA